MFFYTFYGIGEWHLSVTRRFNIDMFPYALPHVVCKLASWSGVVERAIFRDIAVPFEVY